MPRWTLRLVSLGQLLPVVAAVSPLRDSFGFSVTTFANRLSSSTFLKVSKSGCMKYFKLSVGDQPYPSIVVSLTRDFPQERPSSP